MKYITYILYTHDNVPFYVGAGNENRISDHFKGVGGVKKVNEIIKWHSKNGLNIHHKVIESFDSRESAFAKEVELIAEIGKIENGGTLVNICDGGAGVKGLRRSAEQVSLMSKNSHERFKRIEERKKTSIATKIGMASTDVRKKISLKLKEKWKDQDFRCRQSIIHKGIKDSDETRKKKSNSLVACWANGQRVGKYSDEIVFDIYKSKGVVSAKDMALKYGMNPTYIHKIWRHERCLVALNRLGLV
jgi:hypothetical protein